MNFTAASKHGAKRQSSVSISTFRVHIRCILSSWLFIGLHLTGIQNPFFSILDGVAKQVATGRWTKETPQSATFEVM